MKSFLLVLMFMTSTAVLAQEGLLPGEPDPNAGPHKDHAAAKCPKGQKRMQKMQCGMKDAPGPSCANYAPVFECRAKPEKLHCKKPKALVPVYQCD